MNNRSVLLMTVALAACGGTTPDSGQQNSARGTITAPGTTPAPDAVTATITSTTATNGDIRSHTTTPVSILEPTATFERSQPERVDTTVGGPPPLGETPAAVLDRVLHTAELATGINRQSFEITRSEAMVWSDGSLGCPQPDEVYTQAAVDGFRVQIAADGLVLDYRVGEGDRIVACDAVEGLDAIRPIDP